MPLPSPSVSDADRQYQMLIEATTATKSSSITDPEVQKLIESTSGFPGAKAKGNREDLIRATSGVNN